MSQKSNIITLCGFSGAGKTIIAEAFAKAHRDYSFIDLDAFIEKKHSLSVSEIFASKGEAAFREFEYSALKELLAQPQKLIISLGGGTLIQQQTFQLVKTQSLCIYLKCSPQVLAERIAEEKEKEKRPLLVKALDGCSAAEERKLILGWVEKTLAEREPQYMECAAAVIDTTEWNEDEILRKISEVMQSV